MNHVAFSDRLYVPAIDVICVDLHYEHGLQWSVFVRHRHSGEDWNVCPTDVYGALGPGEALDTSSSALSELLSWP